MFLLVYRFTLLCLLDGMSGPGGFTYNPNRVCRLQGHTLSFQLPPHGECDCAIDLLQGALLPKSHVYPLSMNLEVAMEAYIQDSLKQHILCPCTSSVTVGFFIKKIGDYIRA